MTPDGSVLDQLNAGTLTRAQAVANLINSQALANTWPYCQSYNTGPVTATGYTTTGDGNAGTPQTITVNYSNPAGASDIGSGQIYIGPDDPNQSTANGCYVEWYWSPTVYMV